MADDKSLIELKKHEILCRENENNRDLYLLDEGKLLVCVTRNSRVTPLAYIEPGSFIGEMSYFDGAPRSANIIAMTPCRLLKIPYHDMEKMLPDWIIRLSRFFTKQIRLTDSVINEKGIRKKKNVNSISFTIEEQTFYYNLLNKSK